MRELAFVSADPHGKPRASDRKLIRSHCSTIELPDPSLGPESRKCSSANRPLVKEKNRKIGVRKVDPARSKVRATIASNGPVRDGQETEVRQPSRQSRSSNSPETGCIEISCTGYQPSQLEAALAAFAYKVDSAALELLQRCMSHPNDFVCTLVVVANGTRATRAQS